MYSVPCAAAKPFVLEPFVVSKVRMVGPSARRPDMARTFTFLPSTASACNRQKVSLLPFPIPRIFFLPVSPVTEPVTVAPFAITVLLFTSRPSTTVKRSGPPSGASEGTSAVRTIRNGSASSTATGVSATVARRGAGLGASVAEVSVLTGGNGGTAAAGADLNGEAFPAVGAAVAGSAGTGANGGISAGAAGVGAAVCDAGA